MKDNKKLRKIVNPLFSVKSEESISLINIDRITKNEDLAKTLTNFLVICKKLGIKNVFDKEANLTNIEDPILKAFTKYKNHSSILRIKSYMKEKLNLTFSFDFVNKTKISKETDKLEKKKACQENVIPVKLIKSTID